MEIIIRRMEVRDIEAIVHLDREILGQSLGEETYRLELYDNPYNEYYVMEDMGHIIGHIGLWMDPPLAQVLNFYIIESRRKTGLGRYLFESTLTYCMSKQVHTLTLEVRPTNTNAIRFYEHFGFVKVATRERYYADGEDAYLLLKSL